MFTGIIESIGTIANVQNFGKGKRLTIDVNLPLEEIKIGDSIAVNGACLTVITINGKSIQLDVSPETVEKTNLNKIKNGDLVNLERALRFSDRLNGHIVSGHVDGKGIVKKKINIGNVICFSVGIPEFLSYYIIHKGSVTVDGVSLTVNKCDLNSFDISIIPHTAKITTIGTKNVGDVVNIEVDLIGKYIEKLITKKTPHNKNSDELPKIIDENFLKMNGFA